jgi:two-component system sensor kinase FixL
MGAIMKVNRPITKLFGYVQRELEGQNISVLMPSIYAEKHQGFMERFIRYEKRRILGLQYRTFGLNNRGFAFPLTILIKYNSFIKDG